MELKMLVIADIHNQKITLKNIVDTVNNFEAPPTLCLVAGDITNFGSVNDLNTMLHIVTSNFQNTLFVIGNCDPYFELDELTSSAKFIEAKPHKTSFFTTIGFGRNNPQIKKRIFRKLEKKNEKVCLLTHTPPFGTTADRVSIDKHAGSKEIRNTIERFSNIFMAISGHVHESSTISSLNGCTVVNPGPITRGNFAILNVKRNFQVDGTIYNINEM
ncbi:MAG: metallophosphoesterase family protein [Candidatus Heimdallarchaeota archaeon]|nr:metallophosphoesterase family protein [Candidatus Heimdallarchaeota archaeon]MCK4953807.1 metallophosphoesterase family protein [Candidatus Heimdallarchaeota archaeon]